MRDMVFEVSVVCYIYSQPQGIEQFGYIWIYEWMQHVYSLSHLNYLYSYIPIQDNQWHAWK